MWPVGYTFWAILSSRAMNESQRRADVGRISISGDGLTVTEPHKTELSLTLDSVLESVERVEVTAEEFARRAQFDDDTASHIGMVAREAAANAVIHGNRGNPAKRVRARFLLTDDALTISICDEGSGLDVQALRDPLAEENLHRANGRGIFLMKAIMDEVHFRQLSPGTEIVMKKRRGQKETEG